MLDPGMLKDCMKRTEYHIRNPTARAIAADVAANQSREVKGPTMIKCSECGYENMDGLDYCDGCGIKLNQGAASPEAAPAAAPDAPTGAIGAPPNAPESGPAQPRGGRTAGRARAGRAARASLCPGGHHPARASAGGSRSRPRQPLRTCRSHAPAFKAKLKIVRGGRQGQEFPLERRQQPGRSMGPRDRLISRGRSRSRRS